ncbi:MAG: serine hydrolase [Chthoniobacterales bacterium]
MQSPPSWRAGKPRAFFYCLEVRLAFPYQKSVRLGKMCERIFVLLFFGLIMTARADFQEFQKIPFDGTLAAALQRTAEATLRDFPKLTPENLALSVIDLTNPAAPMRADYHGDTSFYPASVMKLFIMVETFRQGKHTPEIERALREMIRVSDNDATAYLLDVLTGTTAGPELAGEALAEFIERRRALNRTFEKLGYDISVMMKPWSFGPYGREMQLVGEKRENRNRACANALAALLDSIVRRRAVSAEASEAMLALIERPLDPPRPEENQVRDFLGESLPPGTKLWSKSGETSEVRHDAAYVELPGGRKLVIVILTRAGEVKEFLPAIGKQLIADLPDRRGKSATPDSD